MVKKRLRWLLAQFNCGKGFGMVHSKRFIAIAAALCAVLVAVMVAAPLFVSAPASGKNAGKAPATASDAGKATAALGPEDTAATPESSDASNVVQDDPAAYEPGFVLATLAEGVTIDDAVAAISEIPQLSNVSATEVVDNLVKLALPPSVTVKEATELVSTVDVVDAAQPNYRYYPMTMPAQGAQGLAASIESATGAAGTSIGVNSAAGASSRDDAAGTLQAASLGSVLGLQSAPNDPYYDKQWHLNRVKAEEAWATASKQGMKQTTVAVIDAGFLVAHEDLADNVVASYDATKKQAGISPDNANKGQLNHGTHCAGIIGAITNNAMGVAGLTGSTNTCKVLPVRVQDANGSMYTSYVATAYSYLVKNKDAYNIRVVNMSLGTASNPPANRATDKVLYDALQKGYDAGIMSVVAACNDSEGTPPYNAIPTDYENVVSVIALSKTSSNDEGVERASYSNYNVSGQIAKNISAPGTSILSLRATPNQSGDEFDGLLYGYMDGTSMASPVVAGIMGLVFASNPKLTVGEATSKLYSTAVDLKHSRGTTAGWDRATGFGEVNAADAVSADMPYLSGAKRISVGTPKTLPVKINGVKQSAHDWTWTSSDKTIATVDANGTVKGKSPGRTIITAKKGSLRAQQVVTVRVPVKRLKVTFAKKATYSGSTKRLAPTVTFAGKELAKGQDYTLRYSNNVNAGKATVTITGVEPYFTGKVNKTFKIAKAPIKKANVKLSAKTLKYRGKAQKPKVTVYDIGKNKKVKLRQGVDYKVTGKAVVRGKGLLKITAKKACANFTGSTTVTFRVV